MDPPDPAPEPGGRPVRRPLLRESLFRRTALFAPAVLGVSAALAFAASGSLGSRALGILSGMLAASAALVVVMHEVSRTRGDSTRRTGTVIGAILAAGASLQPFSASVSAFLARAFGPTALGLPVTVVAAAATALLLGPPLVVGSPSLLALTLASQREGALGGRATMLLWIAGLAEVPEPLRADRNRVRASLAWMSFVFACWIGYTAWRGI